MPLAQVKIQEQMIAQALLSTTSATSIFSPNENETVIIREMSIVNVSSADATVTLYFCNDGTEYGDRTTIYPGKAYNMGAGEAEKIGCFIPMNNSSGNFAYASSVASAISVTLWGVVIKKELVI